MDALGLTWQGRRSISRIFEFFLSVVQELNLGKQFRGLSGPLEKIAQKQGRLAARYSCLLSLGDGLRV